ncbi:Oidioi.mRNA.OKI2018_I69.PAR.g9776.t1.cds [Oikopleura dioica]|uniref:Oidioi.mRNA.OKI2018_I69.PAR.g9776.t1.cds n=1 Tax=Oikopleura dioica TaxID=34765 RepID=A0ABN7RSL5_OIKDI|nr:Oidioi.mRNA.OKI2018_I69.PAR.g9776.t1.cds [Oikopleura dioica]
MTSPIYCATDGTGPGSQWIRTRSGWRSSESESTVEESPPDKEEVKELLSSHVTKQWHKQCLVQAQGIKGAPPSRAGASENLSYLPILTKTTQEFGYTTLGEALRRLNFLSALDDRLKFNFILDVVHLCVKDRLLSLSGFAIRRLLAIISHIIDKMEERSEFGARDDLHATLEVFIKKLTEFKKIISCSHSGIQQMINQSENLKLRLHSLQLPEVQRQKKEVNIIDLPNEIQDKILLSLTTPKDFDRLAKANSNFGEIVSVFEELHLKNMVDFHWQEEQKRDWRLPIWKSDAPKSDSVNLSASDLRNQHQRLLKKHGLRKEYSSILIFCPKNSILFWDDAEHPYSIFEENLKEIFPADFVSFFD